MIKGELATTYHITLSEGDYIEEEDAEIVPPELEEGVKATVDELKEINLGDVENPWPIYISALLTDNEETKGSSPSTVNKKRSSPYQASSMPIRPELVLLIEIEVKKLIEVGFIREGLKWRMPKDDFPLPIAKHMIDATIGHEALSFMDGSSGYNQIPLVFAIQKLKHYFQAHIVRLVSKANPLKYVMSKSVLSNRLAEWELSNDLPDENVIVIEVTPPWKMYFDGASHKEGAGAGVIFITSDGERLIGWLGDVEIEHMPRKDNKQADALAKLASTLTTLEDNAHVPICKSWVVTPIFDDDDEGEEEEELHVFEVLDIERTDWRKPLIDYLNNGEAIQAMEETHSEVCDAHQSGPKLHFQPLLPTVASWPFDAWGLDVVGPLTKCSAGHLYILAATDYFSKWAEAVPLKEVKKENVADFIRINIIYRYEIPRYIITDNRSLFATA
ncbi:UNVERIFIED_CONTAM: hypothetical protein Scaly_3151000 [Sesamum calycinum]|uniref:Integrase catalytic domain-containing protein n=1 Tax=Sesamum calycinum TaxID=2727403 RepID=A0AAW2JH88_9LAMI